MYIERLEAFCFRNLKNLALTVNKKFIILYGDNGQGKTNILEAIYLAFTGKSFRTPLVRELLQYDKEKSLVRVSFSAREVKHDIELQLTKQAKVLKVDHHLLHKASKLLELVNVIAFFPDDLCIAKGSPSNRRNFIDRAIANDQALFVDTVLAYNKALKARNSLLKQYKYPDLELLSVYDEQLLNYGQIIHSCRENFLKDLLPLASNYFFHLTKERLQLGVVLKSGLANYVSKESSAAAFKDVFQEALRANYQQDCFRGATSVGPHLADLILQIEGKEARSFASQGEQRALILSLKLAELQMLEQRLGVSPILLLDDVTSELDKRSSEILFAEISKSRAQTWLTTTLLNLPHEEYLRADNTQVLAIKNGEILES